MSGIINILITIDTDSVQKNYPNPSKDQNHPTGIAHDLGYMVCTGTTVNNNAQGHTTQGTGDLDFNAKVGDMVRAFAVSGSDNFEDSVLLYGMPMFSGTQVMSPFNYLSFQKSAIIPQSTIQPLPARIVPETFWFYQASVVQPGTEGYMVQFALYTRDPNTAQPVLKGYYYWDPTIRVAG